MSKVLFFFFFLKKKKKKKKNKMGTSLVSSTSTLVERGGVVGKWIMQLSMLVSVSKLANTKDSLQRQPEYHGCFLGLSIAVLDPVDRVQPRSRTTCVGWLARFTGVATIHVV